MPSTGQISNPFTLNARCHSDGYQTSRIVVSLTNHSGCDVVDFSFCFTIVRDLIGDTFVGATLIHQQGSFHEIIPHGFDILKNGDTWEFSAENTKMPFYHNSDGLMGCFLKVNNLEQGEYYIDVPHAYLEFPEFNTPVTEVTVPKQSPCGNAHVPIVPAPKSVSFGTDGCCRLTAGFAFTCADAELSGAIDGAIELSASLFHAYSPLYKHKDGTPVVINRDNNLPIESYTLTIGTDCITITAGHTKGVFYALISLLQLAHKYDYGRTVSIDDAPLFAYRGQHLDVVRQFYTVDEVKRILDICALHKINVLHWHLTDDEAWRLEIKAIPELTEKLSHRGVHEIVPPLFGSNHRSYGGYYTQDQVKDIIAHATARGIDVIPEIDVPGHCHGVLLAFDDLVEVGDTSQYVSVQNYPQNTLNPALPATYEFLETVIAEVANLFPSPYLHIGADERPSGAWLGSPKCRELMAEQGLADTQQLQTYFVKRVWNIVTKYGKTMGAWEEASEDGDIDPSTYIVSWRGSEAGINASKKGHKVIMSPAQYLYWDMAQSPHPYDSGLSWAGYSDVAKTYGYNPLECSDKGKIPPAIREKIWGIQGCLWSETLYEKQRVEFMILPRLCAMAEVAWTPPNRKNQDQFLYTLDSALLPLFTKGNVGYRPLDFISNHHTYIGRI